jgi:hypothetical protein
MQELTLVWGKIIRRENDEALGFPFVITSAL